MLLRLLSLSVTTMTSHPERRLYVMLWAEIGRASAVYSKLLGAVSQAGLRLSQ